MERLLLGADGRNKQAGTVKDASVLTPDYAAEWQEEVEFLYQRLESLYQQGLVKGVPKELARIILPVGRYSRMRASANLRNWLGFLNLRDDAAAQWEIRQYAKAVRTIAEAHFPRTLKLFSETT
jgi:thymidylate synthase (FAD)